MQTIISIPSQDTSQPSLEWIKLFMHIMIDEKITSQLRKKLKSIVKDEPFSEETISTNLRENNSR